MIEYECEDGFVDSYRLPNELLVISAHSDRGKYTISMMRAMIRLVDKEKVLVAQLPFERLIKLFSKHCNLELMEDTTDIYYIRRK
jgi:hypothetical protein